MRGRVGALPLGASEQNGVTGINIVKVRRRIIYVAVAFLCVSACQQQAQKPVVPETGTGPSFAADVQPIFDFNCVQCHVREAPQAGLVLEEGASYAALVGVRSQQAQLFRVKPGAANESYLIDKLKGRHLTAGGMGLGMPLVEGSYTQLAPDKLTLIEKWINDGAKNN